MQLAVLCGPPAAVAVEDSVEGLASVPAHLPGHHVPVLHIRPLADVKVDPVREQRVQDLLLAPGVDGVGCRTAVEDEHHDQSQRRHPDVPATLGKGSNPEAGGAAALALGRASLGGGGARSRRSSAAARQRGEAGLPAAKAAGPASAWPSCVDFAQWGRPAARGCLAPRSRALHGAAPRPRGAGGGEPRGARRKMTGLFGTVLQQRDCGRRFGSPGHRRQPVEEQQGRARPLHPAAANCLGRASRREASCWLDSKVASAAFALDLAPISAYRPSRAVS